MIFVSDPVQHDPLSLRKGPKPNRYTPHQGKQEIARRVARLRTPAPLDA
jgi:hypothetical protein